MTRILPRMIGLTGAKYAGKTEAAKYLETLGYAGSPITDPMIEMARPLLLRMGVDPKEVDRRIAPSGDMKEDPIPGYEWLSGRKILQAIGKDLRDALSRPSGNPPSDGVQRTNSRLFLDLWLDDNRSAQLLVNQSIRYPFEGEFTTDSGGVTWRIINPEAPASGDVHESERQDWPVTREIIAPHSKGILYLHKQIETALEDYQGS